MARINFLRDVVNQTKKINKQILIKLNGSETKNESLCAKLHEINYVIDSLILDNSLLVDKVECLKDELIGSKYDLPNASSAKLVHILSSQKPYGDKCGLGFDKNASTSKIHLSTREI
jgi:hypothetical protein